MDYLCLKSALGVYTVLQQAQTPGARTPLDCFVNITMHNETSTSQIIKWA